jgi:CO/xanthine dehydrogenase Mo-binding subunit
MVAGSYNIPHTLLEGYCVYTNQVPGGYFRAPGEVQTLFAVESHVDMIAEAMGIDPLEFRLRNGLKKGDTRATGESLSDPYCTEVLQRVAKISAWGKSRAKKALKPLQMGHGVGRPPCRPWRFEFRIGP